MTDQPIEIRPPATPRRPVAWEDDLSKNTLDDQPFENLPPVLQHLSQPMEKNPRLRRLEELLQGESILDWMSRDTFPIPAVEDRENYNPESHLDYWMGGLEDFLKVQAACQRYAIHPQTVFDFGCASGRLIRQYLAQSEIPEIWGSDINGRHIRWLQQFLPERVKPIFNYALPSLPLRDNSVDVITAFSVFTHIDTFETCWLAEFTRIMRDDGLCYLTIQNEDTWQLLRDQLNNPNNRLLQSMIQIDPTVVEKIQQPLPDTRSVYRFRQDGPYRAQVFHSNNYLRQVWGRFFTIEEILPVHHNRQTVVILRKK